MLYNMKKLKAYTLLEVTVVMILSSISIGITYTAFGLLHNSYNGFRARNSNMSQLILSDRIVKKDFSGSTRIICVVDGLLLQLDSGQLNMSSAMDLFYVISSQFVQIHSIPALIIGP